MSKKQIMKVLLVVLTCFFGLMLNADKPLAETYTEGKISDKVNVPSKNGMTYNNDAYYYKGKIYFSYHNTKSYSVKASEIIYRMDSDGSNITKLGKTKQKSDREAGGVEILLVNGNNIFLAWSDFTSPSKDSYMCMYNIKTGKEKYYKGFINAMYEHYKQYYIVGGEGGDYCADTIGVINTHTGKFYRISDKGGHTKLIGKTIYYVCTDKDEKNGYIYSCSLQAKNKKKLATLKNHGLPYIGEGSNEKQLIVSAYSFSINKQVEYKYEIAKKKLTRIKEEKL